MPNLLSANLMRLKKNKCFKGSLLFMLAAGVFFPVRGYMNIKQYGTDIYLEDGLFHYAILASVFLSVFSSLFIGTEYSDGTIRNKMIIGHKRITIYFANLLTNIFTGLIMSAIFLTAYFCTGIPLLGFFRIDIKHLLLFGAVSILSLFTFTSILTMIAMVNSNKTIVAVTSMVIVFVFLLAGFYIHSRLIEPETYTDNTFTGAPIGEREMKNPLYLEGTKRKVYQFLYDFLPGGQINQCTIMESENLRYLPVYSVILFMATTYAGIILFKRKDIK